MRTMTIRSLSLAALVVLTFAPAGQAQNTSSEMLNAVEVRQLAARSNPGDHSRFAAHFAALADRYAKEARIAAAAVHQDRLAALARVSAGEATQAAAMHGQQADLAR